MESYAVTFMYRTNEYANLGSEHALQWCSFWR
jgi:hypothetical protein